MELSNVKVLTPAVGKERMVIKLAVPIANTGDGIKLAEELTAKRANRVKLTIE